MPEKTTEDAPNIWDTTIHIEDEMDDLAPGLLDLAWHILGWEVDQHMELWNLSVSFK